MRDDELFQLLVKTPLAERDEFLNRECGNDQKLRNRLMQRLSEHDRRTAIGNTDQTIDASPGRPDNRVRTHVTPGSGSTEVTQEVGSVDPHSYGTDPGKKSATAEPGQWIDKRFQLVNVIGEGGMGSVWVAEQIQPVRRRVAIKLIRAGRESHSIAKRFEAERQALAVMDHPGIARIFDGGTTEFGQPYFVMELVDGVPLTEFCDREQMPILARLELFIQICNAVQHAHRKGIIHRDLKPGNILVTRVDGRPVPKIIDFGLARATAGNLLDESYGDAGAIVGTPAYMSPEQVSPDSLDVDTRADVYALGVILYELLVGAPPLDARQFQKAAVLEMLRMVREVDPPRPSTKLSSAENLPNIAASRAIDPTELMRWVRGDIDWIVMKALEKDRDRRYDSANEFAADIQRFLTHQPVIARPPSRSYRVKKFLRRHRGPVIAASLLLLALLAGFAGTTWGMLEARKQQGLAVIAADRESERAEGERQAKLHAEKSADAERAANELTKKRLTQIERGSEIITSIFDDLDIRKVRESDEPLEAVLANRLVTAGEQLDEDRIGDPLVVASLQHKLANSLLSLGFPADAIPLFQKAHETRTAELGVENRETLGSLVNLAEAYDSNGQYGLALPLKQQAYESLKQLQGMEHEDTLMALSNLAVGYSRSGKNDLALPLFEQVFEARKRILGPDHFDTFSSMINLAHQYAEAGDLKKSLALEKETHEQMKETLGEDHHDTLLALLNLAAGYRSVGDMVRAMPLFEEAFKRTQARLGKVHPTSLKAMNNFGTSLWTMGLRERGLPLMEESLRLSRERLGDENPDTITRMRNMAVVWAQTGQTEKALKLVSECLETAKRILGPEHPETIGSIQALAECYVRAQTPEKALLLLTDLVERQTRTLGRDHPDTLVLMNDLAGVYISIDKLDLALPLLQESLELKSKKLGDDHPETVASKGNLAIVYRQVGRMDLALPLMEETLAAMEQKLGNAHPNTQAAQYNLAVAMLLSGKTDRAMELYESFRTNYQAQAGNDRSQYAMLLTLFSRRLFAVGEFVRAEDSLREALKIRESREPDSWGRFATQALLGHALLVQGNRDEAAPLLVAGYEGMKAREAPIPEEDMQLLPDTLDQLIVLTTANGDQDALMKWQTERAIYPAAKSDLKSEVEKVK